MDRFLSLRKCLNYCKSFGEFIMLRLVYYPQYDNNIKYLGLALHKHKSRIELSLKRKFRNSRESISNQVPITIIVSFFIKNVSITIIYAVS